MWNKILTLPYHLYTLFIYLSISKINKIEIIFLKKFKYKTKINELLKV